MKLKKKCDTANQIENGKKKQKIGKCWELARELQKAVEDVVNLITVVSTVLKDLEKIWWNRKSVEESRPNTLQHCWDRPKYWEKSWRPKETCCHANFSLKPTSLCWCEKLVKIIIIVMITVWTISVYAVVLYHRSFL